MMKAYVWIGLACLGATGSALAYPTWMDIGTFGATHEQPTCCVTIPFDQIAEAFYVAAQKSHVAVKASSNIPVPNVTRPLARTGWGVTHAILSPNGSRDYCDFLFYAGHGNPPGEINSVDESQPVPAGTQPPWKNVRLDNGEFMFAGYNRWIYLNACSIMDGDPNDPAFWTRWNKAFNGAPQVILSFRGFTWFNDMTRQINTAKLFWQNWTGTTENSSGVYTRVNVGSSIYDAHVQSVTQGIYNASSRSLAVTPSLITSNYDRGYHSWLYYQNNGEASNRYKADRILWKELVQVQ